MGFDTTEYVRVEQLLPEANLFGAPTVLSQMGVGFSKSASGLFLPSSAPLEERIKVGGKNANKNPGQKLAVAGYVTVAGPIKGDALYQINVIPNPNDRAYFVIGHLDVGRDGSNSRALGNALANIGLNQAAPLMPQHQESSEQPLQATPAQALVLGTLQKDGHLYLELDGVIIGHNLMYHGRRDFGFSNK
jgi:hypothetical protein